MTKQEALSATVQRFTNLAGGGILPRASVSQIINYYETLLENNKPTFHSGDNITNRFVEEQIKEMEDDFELPY